MSKILIFGPQVQKSKVLDTLHNFGNIQIEKAVAKTIDFTDNDLEYSLARVTAAIEFFGAFYQAPKQKFGEKLKQPKFTPYSSQETTKIFQNTPWQDITAQAEKLRENINLYQNTITDQKRELEHLTEWKILPFTPNWQTTNTKLVFGYLNLRDIEPLKQRVLKLQLCDLQILAKDKRARVYLLFHKNLEDKIRVTLADFDFEAIEINIEQKNIDVQIVQINNIIGENKKLLKTALNDSKIMSNKYLTDFKVIRDLLYWQKEKSETQPKIKNNRFYFTIAAWAAKDDLLNLQTKIKKVSPATTIQEMEFDQNDPTVPVILRNHKLIKPLEAVTNMFGLPKYTEPDPTLYLAPFFIFFFGFCLTDAGYGILLTIMATFSLFFFPLRGEMKQIVQIVLYGGISTIIMGALFGGWFGVNLAESSGPIAQFLQAIQIVDPLKNTMNVLYFAFLVGIIQLMFGVAIKGHWNFKRGQKTDALLDQGLWIALLISLLLFVIAKANIIAGGAVMGKIVLGLMAALVLTQGRKAKNIFLKAGVGTVSLYGIVGYFSDMLSYSRLLALGLATGVVAGVVNLVAQILGDMIPYVGVILTVIILIGGHIFNLAINLLGSYIHSGRLQFVEFFPKFIEGGGQRFQPFRSEGEYVEIKNE